MRSAAWLANRMKKRNHMNCIRYWNGIIHRSDLTENTSSSDEMIYTEKCRTIDFAIIEWEIANQYEAEVMCAKHHITSNNKQSTSRRRRANKQIENNWLTYWWENHQSICTYTSIFINALYSVQFGNGNFKFRTQVIFAILLLANAVINTQFWNKLPDMIYK